MSVPSHLVDYLNKHKKKNEEWSLYYDKPILQIKVWSCIGLPTADFLTLEWLYENKMFGNPMEICAPGLKMAVFTEPVLSPHPYTNTKNNSHPPFVYKGTVTIGGVPYEYIYSKA